MKNERGQALPMAIMALAIGALVVVPFLNHAGTALKASGIYADGINARSATDAGAEHALWRLTNSNLPALLPNVGNQLTYSLPESLNGLTPSITVTTKAMGSGTRGPAGTINKTILDSLIFDATAGSTPDIVHVANDVYAIAYSRSNKGYVATISVSANGSTINPIGSWLFDNAGCTEPDIIHVSGNYYAIAYSKASNNGQLITFTITTAGAIGGSITSQWKYDTKGGFEPDLIYVSGNYYALAYRDSSNDGWVATATIIPTTGVINSTGKTFRFSLDCSLPSIVQVSSTIYAVAYRGLNNGSLTTVSILLTNGTVANVHSPLVFDAASIFEPKILQVASGIYAIAYHGASTGMLKTYSISSNGVTITSISSFPFDAGISKRPSIVQVSSNTFAIAYGNSANQGILKTVTISASGAITQTAIDSFGFDTTCFEPSVIQISNTVYGIAYRGTGTDGTFITVGISDGTTAPVDTYEIVSTAGNTSVRAIINIQTTTIITATIISWFTTP